MKSTDTPIKTIVKTIKQRYKWKDAHIESIIKKGNTILSKSQKLDSKIYYDIPSDIPRKLRRIGVVTIEKICSDENCKNEFIKYLNLLHAGLGSETSIEKERIEKMQSEILAYKNQVLNYKKEEKAKERVMVNTNVSVNLLNEEIYDFLDEADSSNIHDYNDIEESEEYDKYITISKNITIRLKGEYKEHLFKILEEPLEGKVYTITMSSEQGLDVIELENTELVAKFIMNYINLCDEKLLTHIESRYELDYHCGNSTVKKVISYDTITSFGEKMTQLLS